MRLSVVIPMWNEEACIRHTVDVTRDECRRLVEAGTIGKYELVLVNDASTDDTGRIADCLAAEDPAVKVFHHERNRKLGATIRTGLAGASGDAALYTDADLPVDPFEIGRACRIMSVYQAGIVSGYRFDRTGEGLRRALYSWVYNWLVRLLFGVRVRDVNFAFKLIRRDVLDNLQLQSEGSFIDAEIMIRTSRLGFDVVQIGVDYFPRQRGESTLSSLSVIVHLLGELVHQWRDLRSIKPPVPK